LIVVRSSAPKSKLAKRTMSDQTITEHDVEKILAKRFNPRRKIHEYLVKWDGVPHDQNSWEPFTHLGNVKHLVDVFEVQLAKQKEQRNQAAAAAAAKPTLPPPAIRPERNAKINALDQVSKWLTDEDGIGAKRKHSDDSDFHDTDEEEMSEMDISSPKKTKMDLSSSSSIISDKGGAKTRLIQKPADKKGQENVAEVVLTKSKSTGVVRKTNANSPAQQVSGETTLNEAQIRIVQKGEAVPTGVVRIIPTTSPKRPVAPPKTGSGGPKVVTAASKATTNLMKSLPSSTTVRQVQKPGASVSPRVVTTAKNPQPPAVVKKVVPTSRPAGAQTATTTVGRTLVSRVVKPTSNQPASASEQKIMSLSRQGSLRVTKRVTKESDDEDGIEDLFKTMDAAPLAAPEEEEEELPMTLCPLTGQVLGQAEGEPVKDPEEVVTADPAEVQQLLTNEDGTPLIVTGEDGTIYQVAGKNANGQTVLIAQGGAEGEQPVVLLANDGDEETGLQFGTTDDASQMAQQAVAGTETETGEDGAGETASGEEGQVVHSEGGQQLTIQTEEEGQITAEIVQAELPSPGGTRRVVLLLPDGETQTQN
jgi:Chromo (CHRromatin Organisation MOdifier) domain